jgi:hypothetical protein
LRILYLKIFFSSRESSIFFLVFRRKYKKIWCASTARVNFLHILNFNENKYFYLPNMEYEGSIGLVSRKMFFLRRFSIFRKLKFWHPQSFAPNWCTSYSENWNLETLGHLPYKSRLRKVKPWVLLRKFHRRTNLTALLVTISGSRNKSQC